MNMHAKFKHFSRRGMVFGVTIVSILGALFLMPFAGEDPAPKPYEVTREWVADGAYLGVSISSIENAEGLVVDRVTPMSPADSAGLLKGDLILKLDGQSIGDAADFAKAIRQHEPGDQVELVVNRNGEEQMISATLGERKARGQFSWRVEGAPLGEHFDQEWVEDWTRRAEEMARQFEAQAEAFEWDAEEFENDAEFQDRMRQLQERLNDFDFNFDFNFGDQPFGLEGVIAGKPRLGIGTAETTRELREFLGGSAERGVLISRVHEDSAAELAGLQVGDLILAVEGEDVASVGDLRRVLGTREGIVRLEVNRGGSVMSVDVDLGELESFAPQIPQAPSYPLKQSMQQSMKQSADRARLEAHLAEVAAQARQHASQALRQRMQDQEEALRAQRDLRERVLRDARRALEEASRERMKLRQKQRSGLEWI